MGWCKRRVSTGKWQAGFRDKQGKQHVKGGFDTKRDGETWVTLQEASVVTKTYRDPKLGKVTYSAYFADVFPWKHLQKGTPIRVGTIDRYGSMNKNYVEPFMGKVALGDIDRAKVRQFVKWLDQHGASPTSQQTALTVLRSVLTLALRDEIITSHPMDHMARPAAPRRESFDPPDVATIHSMASVVDPRYSALVLLFAYNGLRSGEAAALDVKDFNPLTRRLAVTKTTVYVPGEGTIVQDAPKSEDRVVTVSADMRDILVAHIAEFCDGPDSPLFTGSRGHDRLGKGWLPWVLKPAAVKVGFAVFVIEKGKRTGQLDSHIKTHWLRHACVAICVADGWDTLSISRMLGHANIGMTMNTYGHLLPTYSDDLLERQAEGFREAQAAAAASNVIALRP